MQTAQIISCEGMEKPNGKSGCKIKRNRLQCKGNFCKEMSVLREISAQRITETVKHLCIEANCFLPQDMKDRIQESFEAEPWPQAREILERIIENYQIADETARPICQDTGMACVFVTVGQEVHIDGDLTDLLSAKAWIFQFFQHIIFIHKKCIFIF